jgi:hypothetical protein
MFWFLLLKRLWMNLSIIAPCLHFYVVLKWIDRVTGIGRSRQLCGTLNSKPVEEWRSIPWKADADETLKFVFPSFLTNFSNFVNIQEVLIAYFPFTAYWVFDTTAREVPSLHILKGVIGRSWGWEQMAMLLPCPHPRWAWLWQPRVWTAANSKVFILDIFHNIGIRLATGIFLTSSPEGLHADSIEPPLPFRRNLLCSYAAKLSTLRLRLFLGAAFHPTHNSGSPRRGVSFHHLISTCCYSE